MMHSYTVKSAFVLLALLLPVFAKVDTERLLPLVQLADEYVVVPASQDIDTEKAGIKLVGLATSPVTAVVELLKPGESQPLETYTVSWPALQQKTQYISLPSSEEMFSDGSRHARLVITGATNASVLSNQATVVSLDAKGDLPAVSFTTNVAVYPESQPKISVKLTSTAGVATNSDTGLISVAYKLQILTPAAAPFVSQHAMAGFLQFDSGKNEQQQISVPLIWSNIPPEAEYRIGLSIYPISNVAVVNTPKDVALHVFGVQQGTCPPGSTLKQKSSDALSLNPKTLWQESLQQSSINGSILDIKLNPALLVLVNSLPIELSVRQNDFNNQSIDYGAMVASNVTAAIVCLERGSDSSGHKLVGNVTTVQSSAQKLCCQAASKTATCSGGSGFDAWQVSLVPGSNRFTIENSSSGNTDSTISSTAATSLSVVRLADTSHTLLQTLVVKDFNGNNITLCATPSDGLLQGTSETVSVMWARPVVNSLDDSSMQVNAPAPESERLTIIKRCNPGVSMSINVSSDSELVALTPDLLHPEILGVRVEVNGQVLSRGGNVSADRVEDTAPFTTEQYRGNLSFLPTAFIMGLQMGASVNIEVVVVAEDGVTSARYPVSIYRSLPLASTAPSAAENISDASNSSVVYDAPISTAQRQQQGWPKTPAMNDKCDICPAGWASSKINAKLCQMCPPGTFAQEPQSSVCQPCSPGTYAFSWGSTHCKHCIAGTIATGFGAGSCKMCPSNLTTAGDGESSCNITVAPATNLNERYAVVVSFSLFLTGTDRDAIVLKTGVNASAESILGNLLRTDTAAAFNISVEDVHIIGISQISRRVLQANVSATLGVDLPVDATEEDIAAALEVQKLSADKPIELLSQDPDAFFGRTTSTLEVGVQPFDASTTENRPKVGNDISKWALLVPGVVAVVGGVVLVTLGASKTRTLAPWRQRALTWASTLKVAPKAYRYSRHV